MSFDNTITELGLDPEIPLIRDRRSTSTLSRAALAWAENNDLGLFYRRPVDLRDTGQRDSAGKQMGRQVSMPTDKGLYYQLSVRVRDDEDDAPVFVHADGAIDFVRHHHALVVADRVHELLTYVRPIDPTAPSPARRLHGKQLFGDKTVLPADSDYFLIETRGKPMLVAGKDVFALIVDLYALTAAEQLSLLEYVGPADVDKETNRQALADHFGPDAVLPEHGQFYHVSINTEHANRKVLIPLGDAPIWATVLDVAAGGFQLSYLTGIMP